MAVNRNRIYTPGVWLPGMILGLLGALPARPQAVAGFAGNAQHTGNYQPAAQALNRIVWSTSIDLNKSGAFAHYGAPLITAANTAIVPVKTAGNGFELQAFNGNTASGTNPAPMYTLSTDYVLPSYDWIPAYQPVLAPTSSGTRLYYAGAGGTVYYIDNPDSPAPAAPTQVVFYGASGYAAHASGFASSVFIDTPLTADSQGDIFFGFRVQGNAPAPLNTTQSGFARIDSSGNGIYVLAGTAAHDTNISWDSHNSAPALSNDESTLYVVVKSSSIYSDYGYLLGLDATALSTKYEAFLYDPTDGAGAEILDDSTASPTVAPDNDVYLGIYSNNPSNGSRGYLLHFSGDLTVEKTPGGFGWDYTPGIVPATMVPSYTGSSPYLIFAKYNNYYYGDGNGTNKVALLDPYATQVDPHTTAAGLVEMREVLTAIGVTPDPQYYSDNPDAVNEWCINAPAVNPATHSIFFNSEDGHNYRWSLDTNSLQAQSLGTGVGQPYVPNAIGPDGKVYTLNGGSLFALGSVDGVGVSIASSTPSMLTVVAGQALTFTATVYNTGSSGGPPTGSVGFQDVSFTGANPVTTVLASGVALTGGQAVFSSSTLPAGTNFITATYSGDSHFPGASATLVENVHASKSTTTVSSSANPSTPGQVVTFTATVAPMPSANETPAMATFQDGDAIIGQVSIMNGTASISTEALTPGAHAITASFFSDGVLAASSGGLVEQVQGSSGTVSLALAPSVLSFSYYQGGTAPPAQGVAVSLAGGSGSPALTAAASTNGNSGNWLSVSASAPSVPANLAVSVNAAGLAAGTYTGVVTVSSASANNSPQIVAVTLVVVASATLTPPRVQNAATELTGAVAPGELIAIYGTGLGPVGGAGPVIVESPTYLAPGSSVPTVVAGVSVSFDNVAAPLLYVSATQINAVAPFELAGMAQTQMQISNAGAASTTEVLNVAAASPGLFTIAETGTGPGAILNSDESVNTASNPAAPGSVLILWATGGGQTIPPGVTGNITPADGTALKDVPGMTVTVGNLPCTVLYAGSAPGFVEGALQVNVRMPANVPSGAQPVQVSVNGAPSPTGVTVYIQ